VDPPSQPGPALSRGLDLGRNGEASGRPGRQALTVPCSRCAGLSPWAKAHDSEVPAARGHHPVRFGIRRWWWVRCCPCCGSRNRHRVGIPTGGRREFLGRVVGAAPGVVVVEVVSAVREWAPVLDVRPAFGAPVAGPSWACWPGSARRCGPPAWSRWTPCVPEVPTGRGRSTAPGRPSSAHHRGRPAPGPGMKGHGPGARRSMGSCRAGPGHRRAAGRWARGAVRGPRVPRPTRSARPRPAAPRGGPSCTAPRR